MSNYVERCIELCKQKNPGEVEFHQTVEEVLSSLTRLSNSIRNMKKQLFSKD